MAALGADGATVNSGKKSGVPTIMKENMPWIAFVCCMTQRLELLFRMLLKICFSTKLMT